MRSLSGFPASAVPPVFSPDNKWMAFTKAVKLDESAPATPLSDADRLIDERFKGRIFDWMQYPGRRARLSARPARADGHPAARAWCRARGRRPRRLTSLGFDPAGRSGAPMQVAGDRGQRPPA